MSIGIYKRTPEMKTGEHMKGRRGFFTGKKHSKEAKKKMSERRKKNPQRYWLGKKRDKKTLEKISKNRKGKMMGKDNPSWRGGISYEPYSVDWTKTLKRSIRERDKYICKNCGEQQTEITLAVHHIDYDKKNCNTDNLITLCRRCHAKTNSNRNFWKDYFYNKPK